MEKFKVIGKEIVERLAPLRKNCITFLKDTLKEFNGVISLVNSDNEFVDNDVVCCTYDGWNHPEYAANPFSITYRVNRSVMTIFALILKIQTIILSKISVYSNCITCVFISPTIKRS